MKNNFQISLKGLDLIKELEGLKLINYLCSANKDTIGYGHKLKENINCTITIEEAERLLKKDISLIELYLNNVIKYGILNQNKFDVLCSLIFNWGVKNFGNSKGLKELNKKNYKQAEIEFFSKEYGVVNINKKFCNGLYLRRQKELKLWNNKND